MLPRLGPRSIALYLALMLGACGGGNQSGSPASMDSPGSGSMPMSDATDYSVIAHWVCRPESDTVCTTGLDALVQNADGSTAAQPFTPAANPSIDCFYVYPTVSEEQTQFADLTDSPIIQAVTRQQVGRLSSRCRVFAPIYRQVTNYGLNHGGTESTGSGEPPMDDVQAAWTYYLQHDNKGRGVVIIGHSQGTILLQRLIAASIDGTATQALLVSAFLAGDPSLAVPPGGVVGGTFVHIPTCTAAAQTGCVYVWASYLAGDVSAPPIFGSARGDGFASACANPASPAGGSAMLKFYFAGANPPAWVEAIGQVTGACQMDSSGANTFVVTVLPGQFAAKNTATLKAAEIAPGWGVHPLDISLVQGNILDVLDAEIATWKAQH
ncbi:MAG TPA: DUF3089 domain-containing protein [Steroidobacteraceae bacterium]|nr:DUF3089 domain-containing protein [Steroidobacteraceae bacterium]